MAFCFCVFVVVVVGRDYWFSFRMLFQWGVLAPLVLPACVGVVQIREERVLGLLRF